MSPFHSLYPHSTHCVPHSTHCISIPLIVSPFHSLYLHSTHCVPIPLMSPFHSLHPHSTHCIPIPLFLYKAWQAEERAPSGVFVVLEMYPLSKQCSRQDFYYRAGGNKVYSLSVHVPALFLCFVPCCLQTENNRPTMVDAKLSYNVPLIIRLPRRVIADLVLASCYKSSEFDDSKQCLCLAGCDQ